MLVLCFAFGLIAGCSDTSSNSDASIDDGGIVDGNQDGNSDGRNSTCFLQITTINGLPESQVSLLSSATDTNPTTPGIQIDVAIEAFGGTNGSTIELDVTGLASKPSALLQNDRATFFGVTIDPRIGFVNMQALAEGCSGPSIIKNVQPDPSCTISAPADRATLTTKDDTIAQNGTFDIDIVIDTADAVAGATVSLGIGAANQGTKTVDTAGQAVFSDSVLNSGTNLLTATVISGNLRAQCQSTVTVDIAAPSCSIASFTPPAITTSTGASGLGPQQDADNDNSNGLNTTLTVSTANDVNEVILSRNSVPVATLVPSNGTAQFPQVLTDGAYTFEAKCTNTTTGNNGTSPSSAVIVDVGSPAPVADLNCTVDSSKGDHRRGVSTCSWTEPSDGNGSGIELYRLRYRKNSTITGSNFDDPDTVKLEIQPQPTANQTAPVMQLSIPNSYSFAIQAVDFLQNASTIALAQTNPTFSFREQVIQGESQNDAFGAQAAVGDFNCDGTPDVAVGVSATTFDPMGQNLALAGEVRLFFGNGLSIPSTASKRFRGTVASARFGAHVIALDYNGDGCDDLAVHAGGQPEEFFIYLGQSLLSDRTDFAQGTGAEQIFTLPMGAGSTIRLGEAPLTAAVDLDGDGKDELAVRYSDKSSSSGFAEALVVYGKDLTLMGSGVDPVISILPDTADIRFTGGTNGAGSRGFGYAMRQGPPSGANTTLIMAEPNYDNTAGGGGKGAVYVFSGGPRAMMPETIDITVGDPRLSRIEGLATSGAFGDVMGTSGDLNGDGEQELMVVDFLASNAPATPGKIYLFNLSTMPTSASDAIAVYSNAEMDTAGAFGLQISHAPGVGTADLNKDSYDDLVVTYPNTTAGTSFIFHGGSGPLVDKTTANANIQLTPMPQGGGFSFGEAVQIIGDINGDTYVDFLVSDREFDTKRGQVVIYH